MVTVRCTGRSFRLVPTHQVTETVLYCLAATLSKYDILVHEYCFLSNHYHLALMSLGNDLPAFLQDLNSLLSRALNALRGWSGSNFEKGYNIVVEHDDAAVVGHCGYILANPCAANLVSYCRHYKGATSWKLEYGEEVTAKRPKYGLWKPVDAPAAGKKGRRKKPWDKTRASYRGRWVTPEVASFKLSRPPAYGDKLDDTQLRKHIRDEARRREAKAEAKRVAGAYKAMGMKQVRSQDWGGMPRTKEDMFGAEPKAAASKRWAREEAAQRNRAFVQEYRDCLERWHHGERDVVFPAGTYLMRVRFGASCADAPPG